MPGYGRRYTAIVDFTLGTLRPRPPAEKIPLSDWETYATTHPYFVDSICHRINSAGEEYDVLRPNAKDINVAGRQAVVIWWFPCGMISIRYGCDHKHRAEQEASQLCESLRCEFQPVSDHFSGIEGMICAVDDFAAEVDLLDGSETQTRIALLEHTTAMGGEYLYLHFVDPDSRDVSGLTRVPVHDIIKITRSCHRASEF